MRRSESEQPTATPQLLSVFSPPHTSLFLSYIQRDSTREIPIPIYRSVLNNV